MIQTLACLGQFPTEDRAMERMQIIMELPKPSLPWASPVHVNFLSWNTPFFISLGAVPVLLWDYYISGWESEEVTPVQKEYSKGGWKKSRSCLPYNKHSFGVWGETTKRQLIISWSSRAHLGQWSAAPRPLPRCNRFFSASISKWHLKTEGSKKRTKGEKGKNGENEKHGKRE